jgi:DNA-binding transcriptional regulator YiaG
MSGSQMLTRERTDWRPAMSVHSTDPYETSVLEPTPLGSGHLWFPVAPSVHYSFPDIDLLQKAWLDAYTCRITTVPHVFVVTHHGAADVANAPETAAQRMAAELRRLSGLTNEEIAPLLGVSRRSFQAWIAGESISARKETRLRTVLDAVRQLAAESAAATRERLLGRPPRSISAYDLLAEERYEAAVDLATGRHRRQLAPQPTSSESIATQLDRIEDNIAPAPRLNRKLSGPLRR